MNAGKDVYCQKPMVQKVEDGRWGDRRPKEDRADPSGRQPACKFSPISEGQGLIRTAPSARFTWLRRGGTAIRPWAPGSTHPTGRPPEQTIDWDRFLAAPQAALRAHPAVPLAELSRLRHRDRRRSLRSPVQRHSLCDGLDWPDSACRRWAGHTTGRTAATCPTS